MAFEIRYEPQASLPERKDNAFWSGFDEKLGGKYREIFVFVFARELSAVCRIHGGEKFPGKFSERIMRSLVLRHWSFLFTAINFKSV